LNEPFFTQDSTLAAYLITLGHFPTKIDYLTKPRYTIYFNHADDIHFQASNFIVGLAKVDPKGYARVFKMLNSTIRQKLQWGELNG